MRLTIVCLIAFYAFGANAQNAIDIVNTNLTKPEISHLYIGVDNPIIITGKPGVKYGLISSSGTSIQKSNIANEFRLLAVSRAVYDTLKVTLAGKVVYKEVFKIKRIPDFKLSVGNIQTATASKTEVLLQPFLMVSLPDCYLALSPKVTSFDFYYKNNDGTQTTIECKGAYFNDEIIDKIKQLKANTKVYFDNVKIIGPESPTRVLNYISLTIR
jgi:hypothetical protein